MQVCNVLFENIGATSIINIKIETFLTSLIVFSYFQNSSCSNKKYQVMVK